MIILGRSVTIRGMGKPRAGTTVTPRLPRCASIAPAATWPVVAHLEGVQQRRDWRLPRGQGQCDGDVLRVCQRRGQQGEPEWSRRVTPPEEGRDRQAERPGRELERPGMVAR